MKKIPNKFILIGILIFGLTACKKEARSLIIEIFNPFEFEVELHIDGHSGYDLDKLQGNQTYIHTITEGENVDNYILLHAEDSAGNVAGEQALNGQPNSGNGLSIPFELEFGKEYTWTVGDREVYEKVSSSSNNSGNGSNSEECLDWSFFHNSCLAIPPSSPNSLEHKRRICILSETDTEITVRVELTVVSDAFRSSHSTNGGFDRIQVSFRDHDYEYYNIQDFLNAGIITKTMTVSKSDIETQGASLIEELNNRDPYIARIFVGTECVQ